jgi:hypothetical protein
VLTRAGRTTWISKDKEAQEGSLRGWSIPRPICLHSLGKPPSFSLSPFLFAEDVNNKIHFPEGDVKTK